MSVGVIVVAAGRGERLAAGVPKQFLDLGGRTLLQRSVAAFDAHPAVDELVVVLPPGCVSDAAAFIGSVCRPCRAVGGGDRRQDSVRAGAAGLSSAATVILIHDAARPFVDAALIDRVIDATRETGAAVPGLPARDTVKRRAADRLVVTETIARDLIWLAQTPQGFSRPVLDDVLALAAGTSIATDEAMLAEQAGHTVALVPGDERNVKITSAGDLAAARSRVLGPPRVGTGYDLHRLVAGRSLVFAGVHVPFELGPLGHSDGDVVCHALVDAILGAAGAGDIGRLFPNTDPRWKDAAGLDLLTRAVAAVAERGWAIASADVTVVLERPKVSPFLAEIRGRLAEALNVPVEAVSVKGKTNEGVDAVGRGEAIAAHAVAVLTAGAL